MTTTFKVANESLIFHVGLKTKELIFILKKLVLFNIRWVFRWKFLEEPNGLPQVVALSQGS